MHIRAHLAHEGRPAAQPGHCRGYIGHRSAGILGKKPRPIVGKAPLGEVDQYFAQGGHVV